MVISPLFLASCNLLGKYLTLDLFSFWTVRSVDWYFPTDVSGQPFFPIFKGQDRLNFEDGTDRLFRNVGRKLPIYDANNSKNLRSHLHSGKSRKSQKPHMFPRWYRHYWRPQCLRPEPPRTWPEGCILWQRHVVCIKTKFSPSILCHLLFWSVSLLSTQFPQLALVHLHCTLLFIKSPKMYAGIKLQLYLQP